ncbi:MAG: hypothetical protein IKM02_02315 [Clostridia bacterium]|nr:hypothetical protein [Clostridia bacterium]
MGGILLLVSFLFCGVVMMDAVFYNRDRLIRLWLGLCAGLVMMMWTPVLFAFFMDFTVPAQILGLGVSAIAAFCAWLSARSKRRASNWSGISPWLLAALIIPFSLLGGYLQYTHILRDVNGAVHVGQSTYGDLCLHLGIATSLRNAPFPPDYNILPGSLLCYPFLADSMVTSMLLMGGDLAASFVITGTLMMVLVFTGFLIFAWEITRNRAAAVIAFLLMFLNGGLGFMYMLDGVFKDPSAFREIFTGFYCTPTNMPEYNLRWVNVICDMMVPQRTLLTGWMTLLPALYMLVRAMKKPSLSLFVILGIWAGAMPMIHTHSFLALGLLSAGAMVYTIVRVPRDERWSALVSFLAYGAIAVAIAAPQLFKWAFPQTVSGGSMRIRFNWVNNQGNGTFIDGYCWFWIKNVGLAWLLMLPAAFAGNKGGVIRRLAAGAACIYIVAELIQFQPNPYDNNKLFYVAYMVMTPALGMYLVKLWKQLQGLPGRSILAAFFAFVSLTSAVLTVGREIVSDYQLLNADEVAAAAFIEENLPADAVILTGDQHNNAVAALTGRDIVCGTGSYLYYHGLDYSQQSRDQRLMLETPSENAHLFERYGVDYVYLSSYERSNYDVDSAWYIENWNLVFEKGGVYIYAAE